MTVDRFLRALGILAETFNREMTEVALEGYRLGLEGMTDDELDAAVRQAIASCRFMPVPAELRELAGQGAGSPGDEAWDSLTLAIRRVGFYGSPEFKDPAIPEVVRQMGGWKRLCGLTADELHKWARRDFLETYKGVRVPVEREQIETTGSVLRRIGGGA